MSVGRGCLSDRGSVPPQYGGLALGRIVDGRPHPPPKFDVLTPSEYRTSTECRTSTKYDGSTDQE